MSELLRRGMQIKISWINHPKIPQHWLGKIIDQNFIDELKTLNKDTPIDLSGENGEYHTMVIL